MGEKRAGVRWGIVGVIGAIVLLLAGAGTVFGVMAYNNAQATREAEELIASIHEGRDGAEIAIAAYETRLDETRTGLAQLEPLNEMVLEREEVFESGSVTVFDEAVASLAKTIETGDQPSVAIDGAFSGDAWEQAFTDEYRRASADEREALAAQVQQAVNTLDSARGQAETTAQNFYDDMLGARHAAMLLAQQLPEKTEALIETHHEADDELMQQLREAAKTETFEGVTDEALQVKIAELQEHLIVYIETADRLKASHEQAVQEREAAEAAAAEAAAAAAAAAEAEASSGSGGGGGGPSLCYRWTWLGTVLEPC